MRQPRPWLVLLTGAVVSAAVAREAATQRRDGAAERIAGAVTAFLDSLRPELRKRAALGFEDAARSDWHFVPRDRPGVRLREMNDAERDGARGVLKAALSVRGSLKVDQIMALDQVLRDLSIKAGREDVSRDPLQYTFTVFGTPGPRTWGWRVEGHHVSLNFTLTGAGMIAATPAFLGAAPEAVTAGEMAGVRPLGAEEDLGRELVKMLDEGQRAKAVLLKEVPRDITAVPGRGPGELGDTAGLAVSELSPPQRAVFDKLLDEVVGTLAEDVAGPHLDRIRSDAGKTFAWIGATERGKPHYFRVRGARWIIEYDTTQQDPGHVHRVWRDFDHDFGGDLLKSHREHEHRP